MNKKQDPLTPPSPPRGEGKGKGVSFSSRKLGFVIWNLEGVTDGLSLFPGLHPLYEGKKF